MSDIPPLSDVLANLVPDDETQPVANLATLAEEQSATRLVSIFRLQADLQRAASVPEGERGAIVEELAAFIEQDPDLAAFLRDALVAEPTAASHEEVYPFLQDLLDSGAAEDGPIVLEDEVEDHIATCPDCQALRSRLDAVFDPTRDRLAASSEAMRDAMTQYLANAFRMTQVVPVTRDRELAGALMGVAAEPLPDMDSDHPDLPYIRIWRDDDNTFQLAEIRRWREDDQAYDVSLDLRDPLATDPKPPIFAGRERWSVTVQVNGVSIPMVPDRGYAARWMLGRKISRAELQVLTYEVKISDLQALHADGR